MSTTAERLAKAFIAKQRYVDKAVDEAAPLVNASDFVLTRADGMNFSIVCIVDAEGAASKRFDVGREVAKQILAACCDRYTGLLGGTKQPAVLVVVEVHSALGEGDVGRLRGYSNRFFDRNAIHGFLIDRSAKRVLTATRYSSLSGWGWGRFLRREMASLG
jgi:hypothetical protein